MNMVNDSESGYSLSRQTTELARLVGDIVRSSKGGAKFIDGMFSADEQPTAKNIQNRFREALDDGNMLGLTPTQKRSLCGAFELAQYLYNREPAQGEIITSPGIAAKAFQSIAYERVEKFAVLVMNVKHRTLSYQVISSGTATETLAHPAEIFRAVIKSGGTRCIVAHNHPSGETDPSKEDLILTKTLLAASKVLNITVLDHLVVARQQWTSIRGDYSDLWSE